MNFDAILDDDPTVREAALAECAAAPEHARSALATRLGAAARDAASGLAAAEEGSGDSEPHGARLRRACQGLSLLRVESAKKSLLRIADEGTPGVKHALVEALQGGATPEARAVLVHLLSDDDARTEAITAIAVAPWPEVLPVLIELAEVDDHAARISLNAIARCGAHSGVDESCAAADFLFELLDDDALVDVAFDALIRYGHALPGVVVKARRLAKEPGKRKVIGLCLFAACGTEGTADLIELALSGARADDAIARDVLAPLRAQSDDVIRSAAERTWRVLDLGGLPLSGPVK